MCSSQRDLELSLLAELECPICLEYMVPPITFCENGHDICTGCKLKLDTCPACRGSFLPSRNLALENLARKVQYPCTYRTSGCDETFPLELITDHQASCPYGPYSCPFSISRSIHCSWKGLLSNMLNHIKKKHKAMLFMTGTVHSRLLDVRTGKEYSIAMHALGEIFYGQFEVTDDNFYVALMCLGKKKRESNFKWEVSFSKTDSIDRFTVCSPLNMFDNMGDIYDSKNYVKLHYSFINRFLDEEQNLNFVVEVSKCTS